MKVFRKIMILVMTVSMASVANARNQPVDCVSAGLCEKPRPIPPEVWGVSFEEFKKLASRRCGGELHTGECRSEIYYAWENKLISSQTAEWAAYNRFYPVINNDNKIVAVCGC